MKWRTAITAFGFAVALSPAAGATDQGKRPIFSPQDRIIIERNASLKGLVNRDPWLVRRALDTIAADAQPQPVVRDMKEGQVVGEQPSPPSRNPDLDHLERTSPEAAHDLFQLIKKASDQKTQKR